MIDLRLMVDEKIEESFYISNALTDKECRVFLHELDVLRSMINTAIATLNETKFTVAEKGGRDV